jgi:hypothetical protein
MMDGVCDRVWQWRRVMRPASATSADIRLTSILELIPLVLSIRGAKLLPIAGVSWN